MKPPAPVRYAVALVAATIALTAAELSPIEKLGKELFFDPNLSVPPGQSCASCHSPEVGWTGPDSQINAAGAVMHGAILARAGNRKPPSAAYAGASPNLHLGCGCMMANCACTGGEGNGSCDCNGDSMGGGMGPGGMGGGMGPTAFVGGMFWDGRATGWLLDDPLAEQAMGPFLNPLEQDNPNIKHVCLSVRKSTYAPLFEQVWGPGSIDYKEDIEGTYERIARSIAAYERSAEVNPFSSKFDVFWRNATAAGLKVSEISMGGGGMGGGGMGGGGMGGGGMGGGGMGGGGMGGGNVHLYRGLGLDQQELMGLAVFNTVGRCSVCHPLTPGPGNTPPLFTDFRYHNLGIPRNPENPFYRMPKQFNSDGADWVDLGLGAFLAQTADQEMAADGAQRDFSTYAAENMGKHKTPTLRNVAKRTSADFVKAYGHNGYFKSLMEIVHFYNTRDTLPTCETGGSPGVDCWPPPEVPMNINRTELGNLGMMPMQGMALLRFLETLSDGFAPQAQP